MVAIVLRTQIGVANPVGRSKLVLGIVPVLVHYTGVKGYSDPTKDLQYAKSVAAYGAAINVRWEYNYLIGLGGTIFEQAGEYRGAHCLNYNDKSYGILFMNGVGVPPTEAQINSWHALRAHLVGTGQLAANHEPWPHYKFRSTACPGDQLASTPGGAWASPTGQGRFGTVIAALQAPPAPPPPPSPPEPAPSTRSVLAVGNRSELARAVQTILHEKAGAAITIDGWFGAQSAEAWNNVCRWVNAVQGADNWPVDSELSGTDWDLLAMLDRGWQRILDGGFVEAT